MNEERLVDIETKIAHQERTIQQLNDVVYGQEQRIGELETTCRYLVDRIKNLAEAPGGGKLEDEKPPHY